MEMNEIKSKLTEIFRSTFEDDALEITDTLTASDVPAWDSLSHINLILAVEKGFGIRLTTREARTMKNVGEFIELIKAKVA